MLTFLIIVGLFVFIFTWVVSLAARAYVVCTYTKTPQQVHNSWVKVGIGMLYVAAGAGLLNVVIQALG